LRSSCVTWTIPLRSSYVTWLIRRAQVGVCDMTHESCVTWLIPVRSWCVTWLIRRAQASVWDMTHGSCHTWLMGHVTHEERTRVYVTLLFMCDMPHLYVHRVMTHSHVGRDPCLFATWLIHMFMGNKALKRTLFPSRISGHNAVQHKMNWRLVS